MSTVSSTAFRSVAVAACLAGSVLLAAAPAGAQQAQTDPRWQAWVGCWEPSATQNAQSPALARALLVCVVPAAGSTGVDVVTVADTQVVSRERIDASGARNAVTREGCKGWENAQWSAEGVRVYLHSELTCQGNVRRRSSGLMALTPEGDWLDVRAVSAGNRSATRVLRYGAAPLPATLPADVAAALRDQATLAAGPMPATAGLTFADVAEASHQLDAQVVEAWLAESNQNFAMNAARLVAAKRAGVSDDVIDVMVALSYPRVFTVNPASREAEFRPPTEKSGVASGYAYQAPGWGGGGGGYYYSPYGWDAWWPYGYNPYSPFYSPYGGYGYGPWYGGYGGWYGGWYYGGGGGVIITTGGGGSAANHGQVVKGRGYAQGGGSSSGREAQPRQTPSTQQTQQRRDGSSQPSTGSQPSSRGSQPASSGSSGSSSSGGRTAHPRPPSRR
ncbi:MAG: hypothetical protein ABSB58_00660 [Gemmatimonadales bacterium]|jgi:hypothetical protein